MTTTQTNPQPDLVERARRTAPPVAAPGAGPIRPAPRTKEKRLSRLWLAMPPLLLIFVLGVWQGRGIVSGGKAGETVQYFSVKPMSFQVLLREKGELKAAKSVDILSEVDGTATIISIIPEGSTVKEGDLLIEMASDQIEERIQTSQIAVASARAAATAAENEYRIQLDENQSTVGKAKLALELAEKALEKYEEGDWVQSLTTAKLAIDEGNQVLAQAKDRMESSQRLYENKFITKLEMEKDKFDHYKAQITLQKANLSLEILQKYEHEVQMKKLTADVAEAKRELARAEAGAQAKEAKSKAAMEARKAELDLQEKQLAKYVEQKEKTRITAPAPGLVVYGRSRDWDQSSVIKEGAEVRKRQTMIMLPDTSVMTLEVRIHEGKLNQIAMDQTAVVEIQGIPNKRFTGKVTKIAALADSRDRWLNRDLKEYVTEITLDSVDPDMKPGATGRAEILVGELANVLAVPVQAVYSRGGRRYVFLRSGSDPKNATPVEVQLGQSSDEFVEVKKGLSGGEDVMMIITEEMKQKLPDVGNEENGGERPSPKMAPAAPKAEPGAPKAEPAAPKAAAPAPPKAESAAPRKEETPANSESDQPRGERRPRGERNQSRGESGRPGGERTPPR